MASDRKSDRVNNLPENLDLTSNPAQANHFTNPTWLCLLRIGSLLLILCNGIPTGNICWFCAMLFVREIFADSVLCYSYGKLLLILCYAWYSYGIFCYSYEKILLILCYDIPTGIFYWIYAMVFLRETFADSVLCYSYGNLLLILWCGIPTGNFYWYYFLVFFPKTFANFMLCYSYGKILLIYAMVFLRETYDDSMLWYSYGKFFLILWYYAIPKGNFSTGERTSSFSHILCAWNVCILYMLASISQIR